MNLSDEERNRIRCSVALSVPLVLDALTNGDQNTLNDIQHLIPTYELKCPTSFKIFPYFAPWNLRDTGKKRVYVNSNGFRIRYVTYHTMKRFANTISATFESVDPQIIKLAVDELSARWVLMKGDFSSKKDLSFLMSNIVAVEPTSSRDNHPPLCAWKTLHDLVPGVFTNVYSVDPMKEESVVLDKYRMIVPHKEI